MTIHTSRIMRSLLAVMLTGSLLAISTSWSIAADKTETKKDTVKISAEKGLKGSLKTNKYELYTVTVKQKDTTIMAERADIDNTKDKQQGKFTGNVKVTQPDLSLTCASLEAWFSDKKGTASGKVFIVREEDRDNDKGKKERVKTTVNCDKADFSTEGKDFTATGNVYIVDQDIKAWANSAVYTDKEKKLQMTGDVRLEQSDGSKVNGDNIVYYTDKEVVEIVGPTQMDIFID